MIFSASTKQNDVLIGRQRVKVEPPTNAGPPAETGRYIPLPGNQEAVPLVLRCGAKRRSGFAPQHEYRNWRPKDDKG